jgi:DNA-binding HxlR family transcriptional regulator
VLTQRLAELRDAGIAETGEAGYALTREGRELLVVYPPLEAWARRWERRSRS